MDPMTVNVHEAKTHFLKLLARVEKGARITVAWAGRPVAMVVPLPKGKAGALSPDDPLLNLDAFGFDGPGGKLTNAEIDRIFYGA